MKNKIAQVWVETVIYTLIGLTLISVVLAIIMPKITESKDRILVEQTINSLNVLDDKITEVIDRGPGNVRTISAFRMKEGELYINATGDSISFLIKNLRKPYSEPGIPIDIGRVTLISREEQKSSSVTLVLDYSPIANITYGGEEITKKLTAASVPYSFSIENLGTLEDSSLFVINIKETSGNA
ncbi:hypothetical protein HY450_01255 [Candidatus Pacearchaeota archaeon]|nr:hypothetical protein [Candidatus Pacearchaeota archaeon]